MGRCIAALSLAAIWAFAGSPDPAITGLDHIPIAVRDLDAAAADYRALGFAIKPGRPHDNGITNRHVKFPDGTELELITAPEARDALTATYRRHLAQGEGPSFLALFAPRIAEADVALTAAKLPHVRDGGTIDFPGSEALAYLFLAGRNQSPTDLPEHFAHANTAESLVRVWLAGGDFSNERRLLAVLGATFASEDVRAPEKLRASVARLAEGEILFLPRDRQRLMGRSIVGATLRVRDIAAAQRVLSRGNPDVRIVSSDGGKSVFLPPARTHGIWLEFWQPGASLPPRGI